MEEFRVTRINGGGASPDGRQVWINVESEKGPIRIAMGAEEAGKLPVAALQAVAAAEQGRAGRGTFVAQADSVRFVPDKSSAGLLMIKLVGITRPLVFQFVRQVSDRLYDDLRAVRKGARPVPPAGESAAADKK